MYLNVGLVVTDVPSAVVTVKLAPDVNAEIYGDFALPTIVPAAAFVGINRMTLVLVTDVFGTIVDTATAIVNVPVTRGNVARIASLNPLMATIISRC